MPTSGAPSVFILQWMYVVDCVKCTPVAIWHPVWALSCPLREGREESISPMLTTSASLLKKRSAPRIPRICLGFLQLHPDPSERSGQGRARQRKLMAALQELNTRVFFKGMSQEGNNSSIKRIWKAWEKRKSVNYVNLLELSRNRGLFCFLESSHLMINTFYNPK